MMSPQQLQERLMALVRYCEEEGKVADCAGCLEKGGRFFRDAVRVVWEGTPALARRNRAVIERLNDGLSRVGWDDGGFVKGAAAAVTVHPEPGPRKGRVLPRNLKYVIPVVTSKFCNLTEEQQRKAMLHEAIHLGYGGHGPGFCAVAAEVGAPADECELRGGVARLQVALDGSAELLTVREFASYFHALAWYKTPEGALDTVNFVIKHGGKKYNVHINEESPK